MSPQAPVARTFPKLQQIHVASPCPADWEQMDGDDRSRFCHQCQRHVYQLSAMTTQEAERLILEKEGQLCVRIYRREDGTVLTADCPVGVARVIKAARRGAYWIAGITAALIMLLGLWPEKAESKANDMRPFGVRASRPSSNLWLWLRRSRYCTEVAGMMYVPPPAAPPAPARIMGELAAPPPPSPQNPS